MNRLGNVRSTLLTLAPAFASGQVGAETLSDLLYELYGFLSARDLSAEVESEDTGHALSLARTLLYASTVGSPIDRNATAKELINLVGGG